MSKLAAAVILALVTAGAVVFIGARWWSVSEDRSAAGLSALPPEGAAGTPDDRGVPGGRSPAIPASTASAGARSEADAPALHPFNVAAAALGGRVESVTSQRDNERWAATNLIDEGRSSPICSPLCAWASDGGELPQEIVLSFRERREPLIARVVIDTLTPVTREQAAGVAQQVELWASSVSASEGFVRIAEATLPPVAARHAIDVEPTRLRFLRVRVLSRNRGQQTLIGEISAYEAAAEPSILADTPRNLVNPSLGGVLVSFPGEYTSYLASNLVDGDIETAWQSGAEALPQDLVFAFHEDRVAFVDRIVLHLKGPPQGWPRLVSVSASLRSPVDGFEEIGRFTLDERAGAHTLALQRPARFLKLRIVERVRAERTLTRLNEVEVLEGAAPGSESILSRSARESSAPPGMPGHPDGGTSTEQEPNDSAGQAGWLEPERATSGTIEPAEDVDHFKLSVPGPAPSSLTVDISSQPYIRLALDLLDSAGAAVGRFDPARAPGERKVLSWLVPPGTYTVRLAEPPSSVVLVWDTSGSMRGKEDALRHAVETYLDARPPDQHVNLIRFSGDVEVLLPAFSSDTATLKAAIDGKFVAGGSTALYDALASALGLLAERGGNRAIVLMTDGIDAGSATKRDALWSLVQQHRVRLYVVGQGDLDRYTSQLGSSGRRFIRHAALATGGRAFFAADVRALAGFYREIAEELRAPSRYQVSARASQLTGKLAVRAPDERGRGPTLAAQVELILDASGSMKRRIGGRTMMDAAKAVLAEIIDALPDDAHVALRVFGHRIPEGRPKACEDSELVVPFARINRARLKSRLGRIQARGTTPIAYSLGQVARDMDGAKGQKIVVLVTDGKEECGGDPAAVARKIASAGTSVRVNVVGFALQDEGLKAELRQLARTTAGEFVEARDAATLRTAIEKSLAVPFDVLDASGARVAGGVTGSEVDVPDGVYTVAIRTDPRPVVLSDVRVRMREKTTLEVRREGQEVSAIVLNGGGAD